MTGAPPVLAFPENPCIRRQGDTEEPIVLVVVSGLPTLAGASAVFQLWDELAGAVLISAGSAVISSAGLDPSGSGTYGCTLSYTPVSGDHVVAGRYLASFVITFAGGLIRTIPSEEEFVVVVEEAT